MVKNLRIIVIIIILSITTIPVKAGLSFGILPDDAAIPLIVASETGLFQEKGLEIELLPFKTAIERDSALQTGRIDGTIADIVAAAFAIDNGKDLKITSMADGRFTLLAAADSDLLSYHDLKEVEIAISSNTIIEYLTDNFFSDQGIDNSNLNKIVISKIPVRLQLLIEGKEQAAVLPEPLASLAQSKGARVMGTSNELGGAPVVMLFSEKAIQNKNDEIKIFYDVYSQVVELVNKNHEKYRQLIVDKGGFPASIKNNFKFISYQRPYLPEQKMVNEVLSWMKERNLLKTQLEYTDLVSDEFIE